MTNGAPRSMPEVVEDRGEWLLQQKITNLPPLTIDLSIDHVVNELPEVTFRQMSAHRLDSVGDVLAYPITPNLLHMSIHRADSVSCFWFQQPRLQVRKYAAAQLGPTGESELLSLAVPNS